MTAIAPRLQRASGECRVAFDLRDGQTRLGDLYQRDPCRVLFPAPELGEPPQAVLLTTSGGVMCPSYLATRDEKDSTRGRARVLQELAKGLANKEIAEYFKISEDTVKHHLSNIFDKLGVSTRLELALFAVNQALPIKTIA